MVVAFFCGIRVDAGSGKFVVHKIIFLLNLLTLFARARAMNTFHSKHHLWNEFVIKISVTKSDFLLISCHGYLYPKSAELFYDFDSRLVLWLQTWISAVFIPWIGFGNIIVTLIVTYTHLVFQCLYQLVFLSCDHY